MTRKQREEAKRAELSRVVATAVEIALDLRKQAVPRGKRIVDHTDEELKASIDRAAELWGADFWVLLHGIDAYFEQRRRKNTYIRRLKNG